MIMEEIIKNANDAIIEKRDRLKEKAERYFAVIQVPNSVSDIKQRKAKSTPPISKILYGLAGAMVAGTCTDLIEGTACKIGTLILAGCSVLGGYRIARNIKKSASVNVAPRNSLYAVKSELTQKVIDAVKKTGDEWIEFITPRQKEILQAIENADCQEERKMGLKDKVCLYEILDIKVLSLTQMIDSVNDISGFNAALSECRKLLLSAIDKTASVQMQKYGSLLAND